MRSAMKLTFLPLVTVSLAAWLGLAASSSPGCVVEAVGAMAEPGEAADGILASVSGGSVAIFDEDLRATGHLHGGTPGTSLRHATAAPGHGVAYVEDRLGDDALHRAGRSGASSLVPGGEITHPAWSPAGSLAYAVDLERIEVLAPDGSIERVDRPDGTAGIFSPVFRSAEELVAVVQEPGDHETHDDTLNNLWSRDLRSGAWRRLTSFSAEEGSWSVVRTPVLRQGGEIAFIRIHGRAAATVAPIFELWELRGSTAVKVRTLPGEAFLAGSVGQGLVWNGFDGDWRLFLETPQGMRFVGCGSVMVDPRGEADPDRADDETLAVSLPGVTLQQSSASSSEEAEAETHLGILVGDFATTGEASAAAATLALTNARVVDHEAQPLAVEPGAYAVVVPLSSSADPERELDALRARFPDLEERSWIVPLLREGEG